MITSLYTTSTPTIESVAKEGETIIQKLLAKQILIAREDYLQRTGELLASLEALPYSLSTNDDGFDFRIDYPLTIRFLDLKKTKSGKNKKLYTAIYNRELYGHIYGSGYSLTNVISMAVHGQLSTYSRNLKTVLKEEI